MGPWSSLQRLPLVCGLLFVSALFFVGCGGAPSGPITLPVTTVSVSPQITSLPVNGTQIFTATANPSSSAISWGIVEDGQGINLGTLTPQSNPATVLYTAPPTPPLPIIQTAGTVSVRAIAGFTSVDTTFTITAPSISVGLSSFNTVALGSQLTVRAYAVGSLNNAITMQVNGVTGGSTTAGTIAPYGGIYGQYIYTAPATMPMTGNTVTLTVISTADPTKTATEVVTLH